eukprot:5817244-Pyramimonas_sp.AAC.1
MEPAEIDFDGDVRAPGLNAPKDVRRGPIQVKTQEIISCKRLGKADRANKPPLVGKYSLGGNLRKRSIDDKGDELVVRVGEGNRSNSFRLTYDLGGGVIWVAALGKENAHAPVELRRKVALLEQDG